MQVNNVTLFSPSLRPSELTIETIHPFCFPPPWNTYLVPRDAHFQVTTDTGEEPVCFSAIADITIASSPRVHLQDGDVAECAIYPVVDTEQRDASDAENEASEDEDEDACLTEEEDVSDEELIEVETFAPPEDEHLMFNADEPKEA
jgi:hypothetical protein